MSNRRFKPGDAVKFTDEARARNNWHGRGKSRVPRGTFTVDRYTNSAGDLVLSNGEIWNQWWLEPETAAVTA